MTQYLRIISLFSVRVVYGRDDTNLLSRARKSVMYGLISLNDNIRG